MVVITIQQKTFLSQYSTQFIRDFFFLQHRRIININSIIYLLKSLFLSALIRANVYHFLQMYLWITYFIISLIQAKMKIICFTLLLIFVVKCIIQPQNFFKITESADKQSLHAKTYTMSRTVNNNQLNIFTVTKMTYSDLNELKGKPTIIINSYMHAREPYSVQLAYKLYQNLIKNKTNPYLSNFLQTGIIIFYPFINIDGYEEYVKSNFFKQIRKNMNKNNTNCPSGLAGVDINRNFDSSFGAVSTSKLPCGQQYRGLSPFSEKQSQVFRQVFNLFKVILAIDIHSYGNEWIYPYASDASQDKIKKHSLYSIYNSVVEQLTNKNSVIRSCFQSLGYIADGVYIDWALDQGAFSLAYQFGNTFNSDTNIQEQLQKSVNQFDILFEFIGPKIIGKKVEQLIKIQSKSLMPWQISVNIDGVVQIILLKPGQQKLFNITQQTNKVIVSVGNKQLLIIYQTNSKNIILCILAVLSVLFILFYKIGKIQSKSNKQKVQKKVYTNIKIFNYPLQLIEPQN